MKSVAVTASTRPLQAQAPQHPSVDGRGTHQVSLLAEDLLKSLTAGARKVSFPQRHSPLEVAPVPVEGPTPAHIEETLSELWF